jgi:hypothetical protein
VIVLDAIAVFPRRKLRSDPFQRINAQARALDVFMIDDPLAVAIHLVIAAAVLGDLDDLLEIPIGPLLARARRSRLRPES